MYFAVSLRDGFNVWGVPHEMDMLTCTQIYLPNFQLKVELSDSGMVMEEKLYRK